MVLQDLGNFVYWRLNRVLKILLFLATSTFSLVSQQEGLFGL